MHEANKLINYVGFVVRGRIKAGVVDHDGNKKLFRFAGRGELVGMISAAIPDPEPLPHPPDRCETLDAASARP